MSNAELTPHASSIRQAAKEKAISDDVGCATRVWNLEVQRQRECTMRERAVLTKQIDYTTRLRGQIDRTTPNTSGIVELQALSDVRAQRHPTRTDRYDADNVNPHATTTTTCAPKSPVHSSPGGHTTSRGY